MIDKESSVFISKLVHLGESFPPEELLASIGGGCGRWQVSTGIVGFLCVLLYGLNADVSFTLAPTDIHFTCLNGSDSNPCMTINGTKCQTFIFHPEFEMVTFTEKFSLVCDNKYITSLLDVYFRLGLIIGNIAVGITADKYGRKITFMIFIPLFCLTGSLVALSSSIKMLSTFRFMSGIFLPVLLVMPNVSVCDCVGNKWRTMAIGFMIYPFPISWALMLYFRHIFQNASALITAISLTPLPFLVMLLYFKESPLFILVHDDCEKAEDAFRKIVHFNKRAFPKDVKLRPMNVSQSDRKKVSNLKLFFSKKRVRHMFFGVVCLSFATGFNYGTITGHYTITEQEKYFELIEHIINLACLLGSIICNILCHWIDHKKVLYILFVTKNLVFVGYLLYPFYFNDNKESTTFFVLKIACHCLFWSSGSVVENITIRLFPTCLRSRGYGVCIAALQLGRIVIHCLATYTPPDIFFWIIILSYLIVAPLVESLCCHYLFPVHNRELPDLVEDIIRFNRYFKPRRYVQIDDDATFYGEIEIKSEDFHSSADEEEPRR